MIKFINSFVGSSSRGRTTRDLFLFAEELQPRLTSHVFQRNETRKTVSQSTIAGDYAGDIYSGKISIKNPTWRTQSTPTIPLIPLALRFVRLLLAIQLCFAEWFERSKHLNIHVEFICMWNSRGINRRAQNSAIGREAGRFLFPNCYTQKRKEFRKH